MAQSHYARIPRNARHSPYYRREALPGIRGLGLDELPLADQAVISTLQTAEPVGVFTQWGKLPLDSSTWQAATPDLDYIIYPVTALQLAAAASTSAGPPAYVALLTADPRDPVALTTAFNGSRYRYALTEGVYRQDDPRPAPAIFFVHWGALRPDQDPLGGTKALDRVAEQAPAALVFPVIIQHRASDRSPPTMAFTDALRTQLATTPAAAPAPLPAPVPVQSPADHEPAAPIAPTTIEAPPVATKLSALLSSLLWVGVGVGAAYGGYLLVQRSRKRAAPSG